jgi:hypothetical protein
LWIKALRYGHNSLCWRISNCPDILDFFAIRALNADMNSNFLAPVTTAISLIAASAAIATVIITHNNAKKQLRAYVGVSNIIIPRDFDPPGDNAVYHTYIEWKNSGRSNTVGLVLMTNCSPSAANFSFEDQPKAPLQPTFNRISLGADASARFALCSGPVNRWLTYATTDKQPMFIWGRAIYKDIFGQRHLTEFSYKMDNFNGNPRSKDFGASIVVAHDNIHNCADEECGDRFYEEEAYKLPANAPFQ